MSGMEIPRESEIAIGRASSRKSRRRAKNLARENQGLIREMAKYVLCPGILLSFLGEVIPDTRISLNAVVISFLAGVWVWWASGKLLPALDGFYSVLSWLQKEAIDDLRDDIQDETGIRISRSVMVDRVLTFAYRTDGLKDHLTKGAR